MIDLLIYAISATFAVAEYVRRRWKRLQNLLQYTDLSHVALATLAANALTQGAPGIAASAVLTALYVVYQVVTYMHKRDTVGKDIAVYTATYATVVATKLGVQLLVATS